MAIPPSVRILKNVEKSNSSAQLLMLHLAAWGFSPCIAKRGRYWRAHVDSLGNWYHDGRTMESAIKKSAAKYRLHLQKLKATK